MAANARLAEAHRLAQARIGAQTVKEVLAVSKLLDPTDLPGSFRTWLTVLVPLISRQRSVSARTAANYLTTHRALVLGIGTQTPVLAEQLPVEAFTTSMVVCGPATIRRLTGSGSTIENAVRVAQVRTSRAAMRHALNGGRETITQTVAADPRASGWERVTSGAPCAFCAGLAGLTFAAEESASFECHDGCSCSAEPVYGN